ncbi:MAG: hypothetical protein WCO94_15620 [Verrucomicrobiota bacterium]
MAHYITYHFFTSEVAKFTITEIGQDGKSCLCLGHDPTKEALALFSSPLEAFSAIFWQRTGCQDWDSIDSKRAAKAAMAERQWESKQIAHLTDKRDETHTFGAATEIPPQEPPQSPLL